MNKTAISVRAILADVALMEVADIKPEHKLLDDLDLDSLDITEVLVEIEKFIGVVVPEGFEDHIVTVQDLESCVVQIAESR